MDTPISRWMEFGRARLICTMALFRRCSTCSRIPAESSEAICARLRCLRSREGRIRVRYAWARAAGIYVMTQRFLATAMAGICGATNASRGSKTGSDRVHEDAYSVHILMNKYAKWFGRVVWLGILANFALGAAVASSCQTKCWRCSRCRRHRPRCGRVSRRSC